MVHRPRRLVELFETMRRYGLEPKRMKYVHPYVDQEANMVLIEACSGGRPQMRVEPPVIVYQSPGVYSEEIYTIYGY